MRYALSLIDRSEKAPVNEFPVTVPFLPFPGLVITHENTGPWTVLSVEVDTEDPGFLYDNDADGGASGPLAPWPVTVTVYYTPC